LVRILITFGEPKAHVDSLTGAGQKAALASRLDRSGDEPELFAHAGIVFVLAAGLIFSVACSRQNVPPLPAITTTEFQPAVRQAVDEAYRQAKAKPDDAAAVGRLGMVLHAHNQLISARGCYRRASALEPGVFDWHYYLGVASDGQAAVDALREALRIRDYLAARIRLGDALLAIGDSAGAAKVLGGVEHPAGLFGYGRATNDPRYYERAMKQFPQFGAAIFAMAQHYQRTGETAEAQTLLAAYAKYKNVAPPLDDPLMNAVRALNRGANELLRRAANLESQGQLQSAVDLHLEALEGDPKNAQVHVNLISLYGRLGDAGKAEHHFREAVAANPKSDEAYYNFGVLCYEGGRRADAEGAFREALNRNPANAQAHNNLGSLLQEKGDISGAAAHFQRAVELQPDLRIARFHLGRIYANQGKYTEAIAQLERAAESEEDATPTYLYALGATLARSGDVVRARTVLQNALEKATARGQTRLSSAVQRDLARLKP
jgi:tetratricopeptide (TPR) repeat protein